MNSIGHQFGNFHQYYSFHPASDRMDIFPPNTFYDIWVRCNKPQLFKILDVGCNSGELSAALLNRIENELENYNVICSLTGVDLDESLISKAQDLGLSNCTFKAIDIMQNDSSSIFDKESFHVVTAFSITMWIHLNHSDTGLRLFLTKLSNLTRGSLIIEPQEWKSYKNAFKRTKRLGMEKPKYYDNLQIRENIESHIIDFVQSFEIASKQYHFCASITQKLGREKWGRSILLFHVNDDSTFKKRSIENIETNQNNEKYDDSTTILFTDKKTRI